MFLIELFFWFYIYSCIKTLFLCIPILFVPIANLTFFLIEDFFLIVGLEIFLTERPSSYFWEFLYYLAIILRYYYFFLRLRLSLLFLFGLLRLWTIRPLSPNFLNFFCPSFECFAQKTGIDASFYGLPSSSCMVSHFLITPLLIAHLTW